MTISFWKAMYARSISGRVSVRGTPPTRAMLMIPNVVCIWVCLYSLLSTTIGMASRLSSMTSRMPERSDSLRRSLISVIFLVLTRSTMLSISEARLTWYGSSVTTMALLLPLSLLGVRLGADADASAPGAVGLFEPAGAEDDAAGREVRAPG